MALSCNADECQKIDMDSIPATALNVSSRMTLSWFLNPDQPIRCSTGAARDYRGLAELMEFEYNDIRNFQRSDDPTSKILDTWEKRPNSSVGLLVKFLEKMERFDVIEDVMNLFRNDAVAYLKRSNKYNENPIQVPEVTSCRPLISSVENHNTLTVGDAQSGGCTLYDAYVCYSDEDASFVHELAKYLEAPRIGLKLFIKDRDMIGGACEPETHVRLIQERCNRMLIILSPEFLRSNDCKFQTSFAAGLAIEQRRRKLIPVVIKPCEIPLILRFLSKIDFTKPCVQSWLWEKLIQSIRGVSSSIFVSSNTGIQSNLVNSHPELPLSSHPDPVVVFPDTAQHTIEPPSSQAPALLSSTALTDTAQISCKISGSSASVARHNSSTKSGWLSNIRERFTSSNSSTPTVQTSSTATSGYQSQSTSAESNEIE